MSRTKVVILHPRDWATSDYGKTAPYEFHHVSIGGKIPRKRNGKPTYDGYAEVVTPEGIKSLYETVKEQQPSLFLYWMHAGMTKDILAYVKTLSPKTKFIHWFGNHRLKVVHSVSGIRRFIDMLLLNSRDRGQIEMYKNTGIPFVNTLYDGFNPDEVPLKETTPDYDVFFGGESYVGDAVQDARLNFPGGPLRKEFVTKVYKNFRTLVCSARPQGWPFPTERAVFHPEYTHAIRRAKMNVNINHFPTLFKAYTRRTIRSLFARRLHITYYIPGMEEDFTNHQELVWFHTIDEGLDMINYYLRHPERRERIAWNGWRYACKHLTFEQRMKDFVEFTKPLLW